MKITSRYYKEEDIHLKRTFPRKCEEFSIALKNERQFSTASKKMKYFKKESSEKLHSRQYHRGFSSENSRTKRETKQR